YNSSPDKTNELVAKIQDMGIKVTTLQCNASDRATVDRVVEAALKEHGRIHTVVSAGGLLFNVGPLTDFSADDFRGVIETDVFGFYNIAQSVIPHLRKSGGGSITALVTPAIHKMVPQDA